MKNNRDHIYLSLSRSAFDLDADSATEFWTGAIGAAGERLDLALSHAAATPVVGETEVWNGAAIIPPQTSAPGTPTALLCNFMDVTSEAAEEFNEWYNEEHLLRLSAVPGVLSAARYRATSAGPRSYLAIYRLEAAEVQACEAWKAASGTPWTARIQRFIRNYRRLLFTRRIWL